MTTRERQKTPARVNWKKVAEALFSEHHFVGRRQKA
jgi:hypothetical protein